MSRFESHVNSALESGKVPILLTPNELAKTGLMSAYSIRQGIKNNTLPYIKIGCHYRLNYTKILEMLEEC